MRKTFRPRLESLEDRWCPAEFDFTGYLARPIPITDWSDGRAWNNQQNATDPTPGEEDDVVLAASSMSIVCPLPAFNSLTIQPMCGMFFTLSRPLTLLSGLHQHAGNVFNVGNPLTLEGQSVLDGGVLGDAPNTAVVLAPAATLTVKYTPTLNTNVLVGSGTTEDADAVMTLQSATLNTATGVGVTVGADGVLNMQEDPNITPVRGSTITGGGTTGFVEVNYGGQLNCNANGGQPGTLVPENLGVRLLVDGGAAAYVMEMNDLRVSAPEQGNDPLQLDGKMTMGLPRAGDTAPGNSRVEAYGGDYAVKVNSGAELDVYGEGNVLTFDASTILDVFGDLTLEGTVSETDTNWARATLEINQVSFVEFDSGSVFTVYGKYTGGGNPNAVSDRMTVDNASVNFSPGSVIHPTWWNTPLGGANFSGILQVNGTVRGGGTAAIGGSITMWTTADRWSPVLWGSPANSLDAVWVPA